MIEKIKKIIKSIKEKFSDKKKKILAKMENESEKRQNIPIVNRVLAFVLFAFMFETISSLVIYNSKFNSDKLTYINFDLGEKNSIDLNNYLKSNSDKIEKIRIKNSNEVSNLITVQILPKEISKEVFENNKKVNYIEDTDTNKIFKPLVDNFIENKKEVYENNDKEFIYYYSLKNINSVAFSFQYLPLLLEKNIAVEWIESKHESLLDNMLITSMIIKNPLTFLFLILILFMLDKQGLFGNKDKFEIIHNRPKKDPKEQYASMNKLIGMEDIKEEVLILADMIERRHIYKDRAIDKTFNYYFAGPSGTGKTRIATALAEILGVPFVSGTGNVETGFVGGGASVLKDIFKVARKLASENEKKMVVIFLDEAQTLLMKRGKSQQKYADDTPNELLVQLDGAKQYNDIDVIFIAASNFSSTDAELDEAIMRRFKKQIYFRLPNLEERIEIIKYYLGKDNQTYICENINIPYIAEILSNKSPAIIEDIIEEAKLLSIKKDSKITTSLLEEAFERKVIGKTDRKTTKNLNNTREIISKHELGHFICSLQTEINKFYLNSENDENTKYLNNLDKKELEFLIKHLSENMNILKISVESIAQLGALGYVLNKENTDILQSRNDLEAEIISLYGGLASEKFFLKNKGDFTTGSFNDIEKVSKIIDTMVNKLGMYSDNILNLNHLSTGKKELEEENSKKIKELSADLFEKSLSYVKEYEKLILFLNTFLLEKYVIKKEEVFDLIREFYQIPTNKEILNNENMITIQNSDLIELENK